MCKRSFLAILQHLKVGSHLEQETPCLKRRVWRWGREGRNKKQLSLLQRNLHPIPSTTWWLFNHP